MSLALKMIVVIISLGASVSIAAQYNSNIFDQTKWERGAITGNHKDQKFNLIFSGSLQVSDIQVSTTSIKAEFEVSNYKCRNCKFPQMSAVLVKIEDSALQEKLSLVREKQYDEFGELIRLDHSTIEVFTSSHSESFEIDCWAETKYFFSPKHNAKVNGFALACDGAIGEVRIWGDAYFSP